jgi:hypothetical protein
MSKSKVIVVKDTPVSIIEVNSQDYISLTDRVRNMPNGLSLIEKWLRNKNSIEFIGIWERINNPNFNSPEFEGIMKEAGLNRFALSVKRWIATTNAIGLVAKTGRFNSGTYAHKDIAFEFGSRMAESKPWYLRQYARRSHPGAAGSAHQPRKHQCCFCAAGAATGRPPEKAQRNCDLPNEIPVINSYH